MTPEHKMPGYMSPSAIAAELAATPVEYTPDEVAAITRVVREADRAFEQSGGGSRHWVREQFLERLTAAGMRIVKVSP